MAHKADDARPRHSDYAALGYDVHGIIPPWAEISERSTLLKKVGTPQDGRGKTPGRKNRAGKYGSYDWRNDRPTAEDRQKSQRDGDGVGILTGPQPDGTYLVAIDADTSDSNHATTVRDEVDPRFDRPVVRVGRPPRALYLLRVDGPMDYDSLPFDGGKIEVLADGQQFVAEGIHPKTNKPYGWPRGNLGPLSELPIHPSSDVRALLVALQTKLPGARLDADPSSPGEASNGAAKAAPIEYVRRAIEKLENTPQNFSTRNSLVRMVAAIKGALPDHPDEAVELAQSFAAQYVGPDGDTNDPDDIESMFRSMNPKGGFQTLRRKLEEIHGKETAHGVVYFEHVTPETLAAEDEAARLKALEPRTESIFDIADRIRAAKEAEGRREQSRGEAAQSDLITWVSPADWEGRKPAERRWLVEGWIPDGQVTLFYGDGGTGKTLIAQQLATSVAVGLPWLGQPTRRDKVMCFFCEDSEDELQVRQIDINAKVGVALRDLGDLKITSRRYMDNLLILWDRNTGAMKRQAVWGRLRDDAVAFGAKVLIIDTIADTFGGNEIDRGQVNAFVKSCLGRLAQEIGGTVIALGHPSMSGKASGSGTSGSTAWSNAVRSRLYLRYPKGTDKGNIRELEGMKSNYGAKGNLLKLRWNKGAFDVVAASIQGDRQFIDTDALRSGFATVEDACEAAVIDAVLAASGATLSMRPNSIHYAPKVLKAREPDLLVAFGTEEIDAAVTRLIARGAVVETPVGRDRARRPLSGFAVVPDKLSPSAGNSDAPDAGVFD